MKADVYDRRRNMRRECDFGEARRNPYAKRLKKQITVNAD